MQEEQVSETIVTSYNQPIPQSFREVKRKPQASKQANLCTVTSSSAQQVTDKYDKDKPDT